MASSVKEIRIQLTTHGLPVTEEARAALSDEVRAVLQPHIQEVDLAAILLEQTPAQQANKVVGCRIELFGRGLEHVAAYGEHANVSAAIDIAATRALRTLHPESRLEPWTSEPPSSHPC